MNKKIILRIAGIMAGIILLTNCVGCSNEKRPEKGTSNEIVETIEVETIEVETIEVEENVVYWPD